MRKLFKCNGKINLDDEKDINECLTGKMEDMKYIGGGAYGKVYTAIYKGVKCAIKIVRETNETDSISKLEKEVVIIN